MIAVTLTRSQLDRLSDVLPNIHDYIRADGTLDPESHTYSLGLRTRAELEELIAVAYPGKANRKTLTVTKAQAMVLRDRLEMAYEIAADNADDNPGDEYAIAAARYKDGMARITAALEAAA